jgi:CBS domain-containing protein
MSINPAPAPPHEVQTHGGVPASARPEVAGAHSEQEQLGSQTQRPLVLRRAIGEAEDFDQLREAAHGLRTAAVALHDAHAAPAQASTVVSALADSLTRRAIELSISELGSPPCPLSWVALGSHGRQEPVPGSDMDSALAWDGDEGDRDAESYMLSLGSRVCDGLARCGLAADERGATAAQDLFVRPVSAWRRLIRESIGEPQADKGLIVISLFLDGRVIHQGGEAPDLHQEFQTASRRRGLLRLMLSLALANRAHVGRLRDFVLESSGEHRGLLDIKHGGLLPVTSIARYASLAAGTIGSSATPERLSAADAAGTLDSGFARTLSQAFKLFQGLRLDHQVQQIRHGIEPDDYLDPEAMDAPQRRHLRHALREVRAVQKKLGRQLSGEIAFA